MSHGHEDRGGVNPVGQWPWEIERARTYGELFRDWQNAELRIKELEADRARLWEAMRLAKERGGARVTELEARVQLFHDLGELEHARAEELEAELARYTPIHVYQATVQHYIRRSND